MRFAVAVALLVCAALAHAAPRERTDDYWMLGNRIGAQTVRTFEDGRVEVEFAYRDRDHGDRLHAEWRLDAGGVPRSYRVRGNNYMQAPVAESFELDAGVARWNTLDGAGSRRLSTPAFYLPTDAPPEFTGVLARALLKAPQQRLALLPGGEARLERAASIEVGRGAARERLTLYRISGLELQPISVWLDQAGNTLIAGTWSACLPASRADALPALLAAQAQADAAWNLDLARRLARTPRGDLLIRNARVFDPRDLSVTPGTSVLVRGERIARVAPDATLNATATDAEVIDARGRFLAPGLWDNHQHFAGVDGLLDIASGVTSARDLANDLDEFPRRVARFDDGSEIGPRVLKAGIIDGNGSSVAPREMAVDTLAAALRAVDWYAEHGYVQVKTYMSLKPELVAPIAERAHARGLRVSGHVPAFMSAEQFVAAGADEIQHFNYVMLDLLWPEVQETTRQSERFGQVARHAREFSPEQPRVRALIDFLRRHHTVLDPTLGLLEMRFAGDPHKPAPGLESVAARFPPAMQRVLRSATYAAPAGEEPAYREALPAMLRLLKALHEAGVVIVPGTDALAGYQLAHELELYARAGIAPAEVLRMATLTSAEVMGVDGRLGTIAAGKLADLILVDGDPTRDIADIRRVDLVLKGGRVYQPAQIEAALGIAPR